MLRRRPSRLAAFATRLRLGVSRLWRGAAGTTTAGDPATAHRLSGVRFGFTDAALPVTDPEAVLGRLKAEGREFSMLALSGGGATGAYGAGVLKGWTATGTRPLFDIVTGVSIGALTASFAFLGPDWDARMETAFTGGAVERLISLRSLSAFGGSSFFNDVALRRLVEQYVDFGMLDAIAAEHARGRRLLVATTNLDTQAMTIWDMGAIAARGDADAIDLFSDVLIASASIPGVFSPVLIRQGGGAEDDAEMHADGGVMAPFFTLPEPVLLGLGRASGLDSGAIHVLVNRPVDPVVALTPGSLIAILERSYDTMIKASTLLQLDATAAFARRNGLSMRVCKIHDEARLRGLDFKAANMRRLFEMGHDRAVAGEAWRDAAPGDEPTDGPPPAAP